VSVAKAPAIEFSCGKSELLDSVLVRGIAGIAGLAVREGSSEDGLDGRGVEPFATAFASLSLNRSFALLREEDLEVFCSSAFKAACLGFDAAAFAFRAASAGVSSARIVSSRDSRPATAPESKDPHPDAFLACCDPLIVGEAECVELFRGVSTVRSMHRFSALGKSHG
jgi:hypothetical protein